MIKQVKTIQSEEEKKKGKREKGKQKKENGKA